MRWRPRVLLDFVLIHRHLLCQDDIKRPIQKGLGTSYSYLPLTPIPGGPELGLVGSGLRYTFQVNIIDASTWEDFERELKRIRAVGTPNSPLIYRGQGNAKRTLRTTLERAGEGAMLFQDYYELICGIGPEIATFAGLHVPEYDSKVVASFSRPGFLLVRWPGEIYRYMAWLRHLGFPSPLLDWSRSPYVAAFFAFREDYSDSVQKAFNLCLLREAAGRQGRATRHANHNHNGALRPNTSPALSPAL